MDPADFRTIQLTEADGVGVVTLDRPDRLNAWTGRMHTEYRAAFALLEADPKIRAAVVTGAGRGFCAGADAKALDGHASAGGYDPGIPADIATPGHGVRSDFDHPFVWQLGLRFPVVAAVNGAVAGAGLVLACFADLRYVADDAKVTVSTPRLGIPAEYGLSWMLPRLIGAGHAADLLLSSRVIDGREAAAMGLANRSLPADEVLPAAMDWARSVATELSPTAVATAKAQLYADLHRDLGPSVEAAEALMTDAMTGEDYRQGVAAWTSRRPPEFRDAEPGPGPRV